MKPTLRDIDRRTIAISGKEKVGSTALPAEVGVTETFILVPDSSLYTDYYPHFGYVPDPSVPSVTMKKLRHRYDLCAKLPDELVLYNFSFVLESDDARSYMKVNFDKHFRKMRHVKIGLPPEHLNRSDFNKIRKIFEENRITVMVDLTTLSDSGCRI